MVKSSKTYLVYLWVLIPTLLFLLAAFNYAVDPMCYFHCKTVDLRRKTQNMYYQAAQIAVANKDADYFILGSSRGETLSPLWIESVTGKQAANLSQGGADLLLKVAVVEAALAAGAKPKYLVWIADYFELMSSSTDPKTKLTYTLYSNLEDFGHPYGLENWLRYARTLVDHNMFDASLENLTEKKDRIFPKKGNGEGIDFARCASDSFAGNVDPLMLDKKIDASYDHFIARFIPEQDPTYREFLKKKLSDFNQRGITVTILIPPYHPKMMARLDREHPEHFKRRQVWLNFLNSLKTSDTQVLNYFDGIPGDDYGVKYWEDGIHPTCKSMIAMLSGKL